MSVDPIRNFAKVGVSTTYNNSAISIVLNTGDGAKLPNPSTEGAFNLTWFNSTNYPDPSDDPLVEIVRVTSISGDTLTVVRGQEGTTGSNKTTASVAYKMILSPTKRTIDDLQKFTISTDQTDFSRQSFQNILKNGNFESWSFGITYAPDGWYKQADTTILADSNSANKKMGTYGAAITSPNAAQGYIYQSISDLAYFKGRIVTLGGWIKASTAARVNLYITDGITYVVSPYHTGSGSWEFLTVPFAVSGSATELTVFCIIYIAGTPITAYFDGMILVEGSVVPSFSPRPLYDDAKTVTIDSLNNRVGINTTIPYQALDVIGNIAITGTVDGVDVSTIPSHTVATVSVHNFDSLGNAPAQTHDNARHSATYITQSAVDTHTNTATGIHNVGASTIESVSGSTSKVSTHSNLTTGVHGVTGTVLGTDDIGVASGVAGLDANAKVPTTQLPALALTNVYTVASQSAQLALSNAVSSITQEGDVAIRTDENKSYVRNSGVSGTMSDWSLLLTPTDAVLSVFGRTGAVAASTNDYTWAQINKTTSSIADITTRSHTALTDIGTSSHSTIDTHLGAAAPHSGHDTPSQRDTAIGTHSNLTTGVHGVTGTVLGTEDLDTDVTLSANSDSKIATQKAIKAYADQLIAAANATVYKGVINCSGNPNYPAADAGWLYRVSVAGIIGGASGTIVEAGDMIICLTDATASGTQAAVGNNWNVIQANIDGAVIGPTSSTDNRVVFFNGSTGKLIKDSGLTLSGSNTGDNAANSSIHYIGTTSIALNRSSVAQALTGITSIDGNAATVTTNANLTGDVTSVGNTTTLTNAPVIAKVLTGYTSGAGTVTVTDSILGAIQKLNGNDVVHADDITTKHLPSQTGNNEKYLTTNGTSASWNIATDANAIIWAIIFGG